MVLAPEVLISFPARSSIRSARAKVSGVLQRAEFRGLYGTVRRDGEYGTRHDMLVLI